MSQEEEVVSEDEGDTYRCQFCRARSPQNQWGDDLDICPKCGKKYDWLLAQDSEE